MIRTQISLSEDEYRAAKEEAQRLGRILRPKEGGARAVFYALVSAATQDQDYASKRQRFLAEQGYGYEIREWTGLQSLMNVEPGVSGENPLGICEGGAGT